jgi:hypothetical protein
MPKTLDTASAFDLMMSAVTALAGANAAKKIAPTIEASLEGARQTASAGSGGKAAPAITSVQVAVYDADDPEGEPVRVAFSKRTPIDARQHRVPIASGGGGWICNDRQVGKQTIHVCTEYTY